VRSEKPYPAVETDLRTQVAFKISASGVGAGTRRYNHVAQETFVSLWATVTRTPSTDKKVLAQTPGRSRA
jgi:hypothetical protein